MLLLGLLGSALLLLFFPFFEIVPLVNSIVGVEDLLKLSVGGLFRGLQGQPCIPDSLQPLVGELFDEVVRAFLISIMLETPLALFPEFVECLS